MSRGWAFKSAAILRFRVSSCRNLPRYRLRRHVDVLLLTSSYEWRMYHSAKIPTGRIANNMQGSPHRDVGDGTEHGSPEEAEPEREQRRELAARLRVDGIRLDGLAGFAALIQPSSISAALMASSVVLVVITLVEATPRISRRTSALCAPIAPIANSSATIALSASGPRKGMPPRHAAKKPSNNRHSIPKLQAKAARGRSRSGWTSTVTATPARKKDGMASSFASAPGSLLTNCIPAMTKLPVTRDEHAEQGEIRGAVNVARHEAQHDGDCAGNRNGSDWLHVAHVNAARPGVVCTCELLPWTWVVSLRLKGQRIEPAQPGAPADLDPPQSGQVTGFSAGIDSSSTLSADRDFDWSSSSSTICTAKLPCGVRDGIELRQDLAQQCLFKFV